MNRQSKTKRIWSAVSIATGLGLATIGLSAPPNNSSTGFGDKPIAERQAVPLPTVDEARGRAKLLYETIQSLLQVVHHEYYREDEKLPIPARTFKKAFRELAEHQKVEIRWLAVTGQAMNQDHLPQDDFEKEAVRAIASGAEEFELSANGIY